MKNLVAAIALALAVSAPAVAQNERINPAMDRASNVGTYDMDRDAYGDKYQKMVRARYEVDMRELIFNALDLNKEEITKITPLFTQYLSDRKKFSERREMLVKEYAEEMAEDDTAKDEANETGDFVENYWETKIDEMELKKDYFDRFEDIIGSARSLELFNIESMYANRISRMAMLKSLPNQPTLYLLEPVSYSYDRQVNDYNNWRKVNISGNVDYGHEYTYNGLQKLLNATEAMVNAEGITVNDFSMKKDKIMGLASDMKKNWRSLTHADMARKAFMHTSDIIKEVAMDSRFSVSQQWLNKLESQAKMIKPSVKLTDQGASVDKFFETASYVLNSLVDQANGMNTNMRK